jgi:hypothetical protein
LAGAGAVFSAVGFFFATAGAGLPFLAAANAGVLKAKAAAGIEKRTADQRTDRERGVVMGAYPMPKNFKRQASALLIT